MKNIIYNLLAAFFSFPAFCQENRIMGAPCKFTAMRGNSIIYHAGSLPYISGDTTYLCLGDTFSLQLSTSGAGCSCHSLQWKKNGVNIQNATSYTINIQDTGRYTFDIFCSSFGTSLNFGPVVQVMLCSITGIKENTKSGFLLFPNPADEKINIQLENFYNTAVTIYNALGQTVLAKQFSEKTFEIDISTFDNGVFYISIDNGITKSRQKIIKNSH